MRYNNLEVKTYDKIEIDRNTSFLHGAESNAAPNETHSLYSLPCARGGAPMGRRGCNPNNTDEQCSPLRTILVGDGALDVPP